MMPSANLAPTTTFSYKDLLLKKLYYPVTCSVLSQIFILLSYLFIANFNILHPVAWIISTFTTMTYLSTWFFIISFLSVVFLQSIVCAKDYVINSSYSKNRFQKLVSVFSIHNFVLLLLHIMIGGVLVWLFLSLGGGPYQDLLYDCEHHHNSYCLNEGKFFLMLGGFCTGLYYFVKIYITGRHLLFPVIQQRKLIQFKTGFIPLLKDSIVQSFWPSVYFISFYYFWGAQLKYKFEYILKLPSDELKYNLWTLYISLWLFAIFYFLSMNLMRFFFNLFITEPVQFPLVKTSESLLTLQDAMLMENLPIVQNLACQDLYLLSRWSQYRRQILFTLSQPGGHPHNWNILITNALKLFTDYAELLNKSCETIITSDKTSHFQQLNVCQPPMIQHVLHSPNRYKNLRNMSMYCSPQAANIDSASYQKPSEILQTSSMMKKLTEKFNTLIFIFKTICGINYLFGELPQVNIQKCLANGHVIIWTSQGIAELSACSLKEDRYGVVQKDLPVLLTRLVQLRLSLEKLSKIPALSRRIAGHDDFNYRMKNAVLSAVKRSLFNLCIHFGEYINDFPLSKDVLQQLQPYIVCARIE